ncbi:MAG TPA: SH3 domain-containing protein [Spirochaetota bacterium]|nr:SH3 domain-containing protein [Spirochaetota bacterium]HOS33977.1 SH3 domain-containing protein [Spirochaetota bacterium]HOS55351.1 SH3 domain-containing protein [Spirochaetota bacterium]HPK62094.1 SH3 domain-containing protein [Spirochaetota bacterium]HQF77862.1 SH3 domain-containing protein [Spirochaetota bacterium]
MPITVLIRAVKNIHYIAIIAAFFLSFYSCKEESGAKTFYIDLSETRTPSASNQWAITKFDLLKLREIPEEESNIINHLSLGSVIEIIKKENSIKVFDNVKDYWYFIDYKGEVGWIFGSYLEIFNTQEEAIKRSEQILFGIK